MKLKSKWNQVGLSLFNYQDDARFNKHKILRWFPLQVSVSADPLEKVSFARFDTGLSYWSLLMWRVVARGPSETSPPSPIPLRSPSNPPRPSRQAPVVSEGPFSSLWFTKGSFCFYRFYSAFCNTRSDHYLGVEVSCVTQWVLRYPDLETYTQSSKNPSAWYFVSPAQAVTWRTVAIIIRVVLLSPYLRIRSVSLSSIHYTIATILTYSLHGAESFLKS